MKSHIPKQISVTGMEINKNKFHFNILFFWFQLFDLPVAKKKLAQLDASTESWVILRITEITTVENQNFCNTKLIRPDSSTTSFLIHVIYKIRIIAKKLKVSVVS